MQSFQEFMIFQEVFNDLKSAGGALKEMITSLIPDNEILKNPCTS
jgi:hypothetical protein